MKQRALALSDQLTVAERDYQRASGIANDVAEIEKYLTDHPAPDEQTLIDLKDNRQRATRLRADYEAASMNLILCAKIGALQAQLIVDGAVARGTPTSGASLQCAVRRKAQLVINDWGRIEFSRGTASDDLDHIEEELHKCNTEFANTVTPLGVTANSLQALDDLMERAAEHRQRRPALAKQKKEFKQLAGKGLEQMHAKIDESSPSSPISHWPNQLMLNRCQRTPPVSTRRRRISNNRWRTRRRPLMPLRPTTLKPRKS